LFPHTWLSLEKDAPPEGAGQLRIILKQASNLRGTRVLQTGWQGRSL
jgi:hypothetical protein